MRVGFFAEGRVALELLLESPLVYALNDGVGSRGKGL